MSKPFWAEPDQHGLYETNAFVLDANGLVVLDKNGSQLFLPSDPRGVGMK